MKNNELANRENVRWVIHTSCNDQNVLNRIPLLTDEELRFCILRETRKTGLTNLLREAKRRKFPISTAPVTVAERFLLFDDQETVLRQMISDFTDDELKFVSEREIRENVKEILHNELDKRQNHLTVLVTETFSEPQQLCLF